MELSKSNAEYVRTLIENLKRIDFIQPGEIPNIDLYMDQVTTFMDEHLSEEKRLEEDKILTKTMINNYTKNHLLPSPTKKKYSKEHMLLLIFIYYFKNVLSISDIRTVFQPLLDMFCEGEKEKMSIHLEDVYQEVFHYEEEQIDALAKDVIRKYKKADTMFDEEVKNEEEKEFLTCFTFICILSFDVYLKKRMIEQMIDQHLKPNYMSRKAKENE